MQKLEGYIGLAIRAGKVVFGIDNVANYNKKMFGIVICKTLSQNTRDQVIALADKKRLGLCETNGVNLNQLTHRENNKVIAITNKGLYNEVVKNSGEYLVVLKEEEN
jgi:hypothetical protein